jgi:RNA recognition motif-containing protein
MQPAPIQHALTKNFDSNLFVKNVPSEVSEDQFKNEFAKFGTVISVRFRTNPHVPQATFKQAFVLFEDVDAAKAAIKNMDQTAPFGHKPISVDFWVSK